MTYAATISFDLSCYIEDKYDEDKFIEMTNEHIAGIQKCIRYNARQGYSGDIITFIMGIVKLNMTKVTSINDGLHIQFKVECDVPIVDMSNIIDLICGVMPSCFSDDDNHIFIFSTDSYEEYQLIIEDVPQNITYSI